jgi:parallel beta-helix repeat protein
VRKKVAVILSIVILLNCLGSGSRLESALAAAVPAILYVAPGGDCDGKSPCYSSPQAAADAAPAGSVIRIAAGTYSPPAGKSQVLQVTESLIVQGGYRPTDWYHAQPFAFPTIFDAQHLGSAIALDGNPDQPIDVSLGGIQIIHGQAGQGGGISGSGVTLRLVQCMVSDNQASGSGGGIYLADSSSLALELSRVYQNTSGDKGGGIAMVNASGQSSLLRSWIFGNSAASGGGGIYFAGGQLSLAAVMLVDNSVTQPVASGVGLSAENAAVNLVYTTLARNTGGAGSGLSLSGTSTLAATNLLAAGQTAALSLASPSQGTVDGVLWGSGGTWGNGANTSGSGSVTITHAYTGDPQFLGLDSTDLKTYYHIGVTSAARDRSVSTAAGFTDIENQPVFATIPDLGADEYFEAHGTIIHVDTEEGGDIEVGTADGIPENRKGAFFWTGTQWVTNDTAAHMYFTNLVTQSRLLHYTLAADLTGSSPAEQDIRDYHVSRTTYTYHIPGAGGFYRIEAARYRITTADGLQTILLNSRGNGYGQASFDIFAQNPTGDTIAIRDGSAWFNYAEGPDLAAQRPMTDPTGRAGIATTCDVQAVDHSGYWMDKNGGSDTGGLTYYFHTSSLPNRASTLGECYPDEFRVKYMASDTNTLEEFRLRPAVYSETWFESIYLPMVTR